MQKSVNSLLINCIVILLPLLLIVLWINIPVAYSHDTSSRYAIATNGTCADSTDPIGVVADKNGPLIGYFTKSGISIIHVGILSFKELNKNQRLDKYEDGRLLADERAKDLASEMSIEQLTGLNLYSRHQAIPTASKGVFAGTYNGKTFEEGGANPSDLSDQQIEFLTKDNLRHVLITTVRSPDIAAQWNNNAQALVEGLRLGIPANNSSDPQHGTVANAECNAGAGGVISMWPGSPGLAATFNPGIVRRFGHIAALEYCGLGITTALSPQKDLASDPRWNPVSAS